MLSVAVISFSLILFTVPTFCYLDNFYNLPILSSADLVKVRTDLEQLSKDATGQNWNHVESLLKENLNNIYRANNERLHSDRDSFNARLSNNSCLIDLLYFIQEVRAKQRWSFQVIDSYAKIPSSLLLGNILWMGDYDECRNVSSRGNLSINIPFIKTEIPAEFNGQYCRAAFINKTGIVGPIIGSNLKAGLNYGLCLPSSCDEKSLQPLIHLTLKTLNKTLDKLGLVYNGLRCPKTSTVLDIPAIIAIIILISLVLLAITGSIVECKQRKSDSNLTAFDDAAEVMEHPPGSFDGSAGRSSLLPSTSKTSRFCDILLDLLKCFSLTANKNRLLTISENPKRNNDSLPILHGLRFLSLAWIILGHTFYFSFALVENPLNLANPYGHTLFFQSIMQAVYSVDTFFIMSGILVAYNFFGFADKYPDKVDTILFYIKFYARRIFRILPTYMLVLGVYVGLWKYVGNGPVWPDAGFEVNQCRATWWSNLLFINNLVKIPYEGSPYGRQMCMGWSWYLSTDMQFFILSPLVVYPIFRSRRGKIWNYVGYSSAVAIALIGLIVTGVLVTVNHLPPNLFPPDFKLIPACVQLQFDVYFKPYTHVCCYIAGLLLGIYLHKLPKNPARLPKAFVIFGWSTSVMLCLLVIYGLWPEYRNVIYSPEVSALYHATSRLAWAYSICWIIFACVRGYGGVINRFLSWKVFVPLSRMTFCAYLIHPMLMYAFYFSRRSTIFYTDFTMVWLFGGFLMFAYLAAFFVSLFFEAPFLAMNRILFG